MPRIFSNEAFRERTARKLIARTGCSPEAARLAAIALHPFSNQPESRELEKAVRRMSRAFAVTLRGARDEAEVLAAARPVVEGFVAVAAYATTLGIPSFGDNTYEWGKALDEAAEPVDPGAAEFAARADALAEAIPPEQRAIDINGDVDQEFMRRRAEDLVAAISRGEWRYTGSGNLIEGGTEPDLPKMRRPVPLETPIRYRCARGHSLSHTTERPINSGIRHGWCSECDGDVWAYVEWDEPVAENVVFRRLWPLSAPSR